MKKVLLASILAIASSVAFSQVSNINKGNWMVGGNVGFNSSKQADNDNSQVTTFNISPNIGYFFIDNFAGGLRLSFDSYKQKNASDANTTFAVSPFVRYYFLPSSQKVNIFADASYGIGSTGTNDKTSFNQFAISAGPAVFLTPTVALEFALGYQSTGGDLYKNINGDVKRWNEFGLNIGFQIHLPGGAAKK